MLRKTNFFVRKFCEKKNPFKFENEDESMQEKYRDYLNTKKNQEINKKNDDMEFHKIINNRNFGLDVFSDALLKRNFLKKRENQINEEKNFEINLDLIKKFNIDEPIKIYEISVTSAGDIIKANRLARNYFILNILVSSLCLFNFNLMFGYPNFNYLLFVLSNSSTFMMNLVFKKICKKIIFIEFLANKNALKIKTMNNKLRFGIIEKEIRIDLIEFFYSDKQFEKGLNFKIKGSKEIYNIGYQEEGIWYNKEIFEKLFNIDLGSFQIS